jgi:hypothetical protein
MFGSKAGTCSIGKTLIKLQNMNIPKIKWLTNLEKLSTINALAYFCYSFVTKKQKKVL